MSGTPHSPASEFVRRAYSLAFFLHPDPGLARRLTARALAMHSVAVRAQRKRLYYRPFGRRRTRAVLSSAQILQRLVLVESEVLERERETRGTVSSEDRVIWFVKHLARLVLKRNSLYAAVGVARLLHSYTTREVQEMYTVLIQDAGRVPDDPYIRWVKRRLLGEIVARFRDTLRTVTGKRGENRLESLQQPGDLSKWAREATRRCTPWQTECALAPGMDPEQAVMAFSPRGGSDERNVEMRRFHTLLHPECLELLCASLGRDSPDLRLSVPRFFSSESDDDPGGPYEPGRRTAPELSAEERGELLDELDLNRERIREARLDTLILIADGEAVAELTASAPAVDGLELIEGTELLEVHGRDAGRAHCLAAHLLEASAEPVQLEVKHGVPGRLRIALEPAGDDASGYLLSALWAPPRRRWPPILLRHAGVARRWVVTTVLAGALVLAWMFVRQDPRPDGPAWAPEHEGAPADKTPGQLRAPQRSEDLVGLAEIERVAVDSLVGPLGSTAAARLAEAVARHGLFEVVEERSEAQAVFKGSVELPDGARCTLDIALVNVGGQVLWSFHETAASCETAVDASIEDLSGERRRIGGSGE